LHTHRCWTLAVALVVLLVAGSTARADGGFALGARAGTAGLGVEGIIGLSESINLRAGYYRFDHGTDLEEEGIEYDGDLRLRNAAVFTDWHLLGGGFRLSAGAVHTGNDFRGTAAGDLPVGDVIFPGVLNARLDWGGASPYAGIGFGNAISGGRLSFMLDLGVFYTGSPDVTLDGTTGDPQVDAAFSAELERERQALEDAVSSYRVYPVLSLGLAYRF